MLHLQNSHHTAPGGIFQRDLLEGPLGQFGIDWEGPCPDCEDGESDLTVPGINVNIPPNVLQQRKQLIDPLAPLKLFGLDIYLQCLYWLQSTRNGH